eukprot:12403216-Karenia_brevis.AAC.1
MMMMTTMMVMMMISMMMMMMMMFVMMTMTMFLTHKTEANPLTPCKMLLHSIQLGALTLIRAQFIT